MVTGRSPISVRIGRGKNGYGDLVRNRPPANVFVPDGFDIGMLEIMTFFPNWLQNPDVIVRAVRNGWVRKDMAKAQLNAIGQLDKKNLLTMENRIQKQISDGCKTWAAVEGEYKSKSFREEHGREEDLTAVDWQLRMEYEDERRGQDWGYCRLSTIYGVVPRADWPQGQDRLLLTQCFEFAADNNHIDLDTSHIAWMIDHLGFDMPNEIDSAHDREALDRLRTDVADPQT